MTKRTRRDRVVVPFTVKAQDFNLRRVVHKRVKDRPLPLDLNVLCEALRTQRHPGHPLLPAR